MSASIILLLFPVEIGFRFGVITECEKENELHRIQTMKMDIRRVQGNNYLKYIGEHNLLENCYFAEI